MLGKTNLQIIIVLNGINTTLSGRWMWFEADEKQLDGFKESLWHHWIKTSWLTWGRSMIWLSGYIHICIPCMNEHFRKNNNHQKVLCINVVKPNNNSPAAIYICLQKETMIVNRCWTFVLALSITLYILFQIIEITNRLYHIPVY